MSDPTYIHLTEEQINHIAERAAVKALGIVYMEIGRSVMKKLFWLAGIISVSLLIWLAGKGVLTPTSIAMPQ